MLTRCAVALCMLSPAVSVREVRSAANSCSSYGCFTAYDRYRSCQCNKECGRYSNCCSDFQDFCFGTPSNTCASIGCSVDYNPSASCQCNDKCSRYNNCCSDYSTECSAPAPPPAPPAPPAPTPPPGPPTPAPPMSDGAARYWSGVNMASKTAVSQRLASTGRKISYTPGLWTFYKSAWVGLPGQCQSGVLDVYSFKCWTPGTGQCGNWRKEGDCYNREHSWPKSWWGGSQNNAYSDAFHLFPSDGYVNGRRSSHPFGEVNSASYTSSEGHKVGSCSTPGASGTCFEPTDRVKGLMARGHLYVNTRYGYTLQSWKVPLLLKWNAQFPAQDWEIEFNNRAQGSQGNRNPYIDFPNLAADLYR